MTNEPSRRAGRGGAHAADGRADGARHRALLIAAAAIAVLAVLGALVIPRILGGEGGASGEGAAPSIATATGTAQASASAAAPSPTPEPSGAPTPSGGAAAGYDTTTASSIEVLVNKLTPLAPLDYAPDDLVSMSSIGIPSANGHSLRKPAADGIVSLFTAAGAEGISLDMTSGYRDAQLQRQLYDGYVETLGQAGADATSARPGYSEHQTGLTADISAAGEGCALEGCFGGTRAGRWLAEHAWEHGFILRYPDGQTPVTGYEYEPWHFRFIGVDAARAYHESGAATYEAFLGAPAAPDYAS